MRPGITCDLPDTELGNRGNEGVRENSNGGGDVGHGMNLVEKVVRETKCDAEPMS